ncbi:TMV resistance protein N-like isoform X2 [Quercus lobata]|uniref:TMV resistance protein N-like isoform X2 n=1 Tax=Quercus lobata TaxID=97700 RepID=UPI001248ED14|nr:TMV resistance protein N-like isoform X2 [Quercus lobata]
MVGIYGLGGVGKTTIAKAIYNRIANCFELSYFLEDVKEKSSTNDDMIKLQETLLSKISRGMYIKVDSVPEGIIMIKERLCLTRFLLILDNVAESEVMVNLLGECNWFALGSRVIITTRDKHVLNILGKDLPIYELKELNQSESHELFNPHAFPKIEPKKDYLEVAEQIIHYANGLPLALKIIGSDLCGKSICDWKSAFEKHKNIPHKKIVEKLKISYDGLEKTEKDIFLDIACFFKGFNRSCVENILDACKSYLGYGIGKLIDKCLITVGQFGELWMHDLLQQMGREIVQQESEELGERSRIWCFEDAEEILTTNMEIQLKYLKRITLSECESITELPEFRTPSLEILDHSYCQNLAKVHESLGFLDKLQIWDLCGCRKLQILPKSLKLKSLKYLYLRECESITELPKFCTPSLENLDHSYCQNLAKVHESLGFLDKLQIWDLRGCRKLQILPKSLKLISLKYLYLRECESITELPEFCTPSLENLDHSYCQNLAKVHESLGFLDKLQIWNLRGCRKLQILPKSLKLISLKYLYLRKCESVIELPEFCTPSLEIMDLWFCENLVKVHESVGILDKLREWELCHCKKLQILPNILRLKSLTKFDLRNCFRLEKFPNIHLEMKCLRSLNLGGSGIRELPSSIEYLTGLQLLDLRCCKNLRYLPDDIYKLQLIDELYIPTAKLRQTYNYLDGFSRGGFLKLTSLDFRGNNNIIELDFFMKPEYFPVLYSLDLSETNIVSIPESLSRFVNLAVLEIRNCKQLQEIPRLPQSILDVDLGNCCSLNAQSLSRLLNQIGEFFEILPNKACKGTRSRILWDEIHFHHLLFIIRPPGTEIPKQLKLNHESDGNVISFWVGCKFPNNFFVCFALGPLKYPWKSIFSVCLSINRCSPEHLFSTDADELSDHLWIVSLSNKRLQDQLNKSSPSERNYVEVICEMKRLDTTTGWPQYVVVDWIKNHPRGWGVDVKCICHYCRHQCKEETIDQPMPDVPKNTTCPTSKMEEIDPTPRAVNNGAEDSELSTHAYINDGFNSMLYPPSKKARKS